MVLLLKYVVTAVTGRVHQTLRIFLILLITFSLFFCVNWKSLYVKSVLFFIPQEERHYLESFFLYLNVFSGFSFVLNETKPLTTAYLKRYDMLDDLSSYSSIGHLEDFFECLHPIILKMHKGIEIWEKYSHLFPSKNIYISISKSRFPEPGIVIIIFNEVLLKKVINENKDDFSKILGKDFNCNLFIKKLKKKSTDFHKLLKNNDYLMGLIYGFGKDNAQAFQLRIKSNLFSIPPYLISYDFPKPPNGLTSSDLKYFWDTENPINSFDPFFTSIPSFVINPRCLENQKLKQKYINSYKEINKSQRESKNILAWSLTKLLG